MYKELSVLTKIFTSMHPYIIPRKMRFHCKLVLCIWSY